MDKHPLTIFPLGDSALTMDLGDCISKDLNRKALAIKEWMEFHRFPGIKDIIIAYSSVSVFYDPAEIREGSADRRKTAFIIMCEKLEEAWRQVGLSSEEPLPSSGEPAAFSGGTEGRISIPVCYEEPYGPDLGWLSQKKGLSREQLIHLHSSVVYRVYMIGFLPGFPYLGKIDPRLEIPRKDKPVPVMAGSVGIAGNQTGIYPLNSPGGWQIIGRTSLKLFDPHAEVPIRLKPGDRVQFVPVTEGEYRAALAG